MLTKMNDKLLFVFTIACWDRSTKGYIARPEKREVNFQTGAAKGGNTAVPLPHISSVLFLFSQLWSHLFFLMLSSGSPQAIKYQRTQETLFEMTCYPQRALEQFDEALLAIARSKGPRTPSRTTDSNTDCAFVLKTHLLLLFPKLGDPPPPPFQSSSGMKGLMTSV